MDNSGVSIAARNEAFLNMLEGDGDMKKQAQDTATDFTRVRVREDGIARKILPPIPLTNDELDRDVRTDKPMKVVDKEPNSPAAQSIPFGSLPSNSYITGPRYAVYFDRVVTPRFTKDVEELRTWQMDIRQVVSDNAIKDMLAEEDGKLFLTVNAILGTMNAPVAATGVAQWKSIAGGISRETWADSLKILPSTPMHLTPNTCVINNVSIYDVYKWGRDEMGGDLSQEIAQNGWAQRTLMGKEVLVTIKRDLVPDDNVYQFCEPNKTGKFYLLQDTVLYVDRKFYMIEFFGYEVLGGAIGNVASVARATFTA